MRLNQLDIGTMGRLLADLAAAHGKPFGAAAERQIKVYHEALSDCTAEEVERAAKFACREFERFPKPKNLRAIVMANRPKRYGSDPSSTDPSDTCQHCGTAYQWRRLPHWAGAELGNMGAHDLQCDCGWRIMVRGYATDEDLAIMGPDDPFAANEMRRRGHIGRAA